MDVVRVGKAVVKFRSQTWWEDAAGPWQKVDRLWRLQ